MTPLSTPAKKRLVVDALDDIKARDILAIDVRKVTYAFDWIVVATAESARQTKALAHHVKDKLKEAGSTVIGMEGFAYVAHRWVIYGFYWFLHESHHRAPPGIW